MVTARAPQLSGGKLQTVSEVCMTCKEVLVIAFRATTASHKAIENDIIASCAGRFAARTITLKSSCEFVEQ